MHITREMEQAIDFITGCCPGQVFLSRDFQQALIIGDDSTWVARVSEDGSMEEAYLSTQPMEMFVGLGENEHRIRPEDLPDMEGFVPGFTC